jgi:hypothetical protein
MRLPARIALAATCCTLAFTSACSDSTSPDNTQDAAHLAAHFDSLYVAAASHEDTSAYSFRITALSLLGLAPALGAPASNITVTTANGTEHWKGFELEDVLESGGTPNDTTYFVVAYRESDVHTAIVALYDAEGNIEDGVLLTNDTLNVVPSDGSGTTTRTSLGSTCTEISSSLQNPQLTSINPVACNAAAFGTSMTLVVPSDPNVDAALTSLSFPTTTIQGVRILENGSTGEAAVRSLRAMLRKSRVGNRL